MGALDFRALAHLRVVADLLLFGLGERAAQLKLRDLRFLLEVDEQPQSTEAPRGARFDGHHDRIEGFASPDVLDRGSVLRQLCQARRFRQFQIGHDQPLNSMRRLAVLEADLFDRRHLLGCCSRAHAVGVSQSLERGLGFGIFGSHHDRADREVLRPGERGLDGVGQEVSGRCALHHGGSHSINALRRAPRAFGCRSLHA